LDAPLGPPRGASAARQRSLEADAELDAPLGVFVDVRAVRLGRLLERDDRLDDRLAAERAGGQQRPGRVGEPAAIPTRVVVVRLGLDPRNTRRGRLKCASRPRSSPPLTSLYQPTTAIVPP